MKANMKIHDVGYYAPSKGGVWVSLGLYTSLQKAYNYLSEANLVLLADHSTGIEAPPVILARWVE